MNNYEKVRNAIKLTRKVLIGVIILVITSLVVFAIVYNSGKEKNDSSLKAYLTSNGYVLSDDVYTKYTKINANNINNDIIMTTYIYSINSNKFTKEIKTNNSFSREQITLLYKGTDNVEANYFIEDFSKPHIKQNISQTSFMNYDNKDFNCKVVFSNGNYPAQCSKIKNYLNEFIDEIYKMMEEADVNEFFLKKDSEDW